MLGNSFLLSEPAHKMSTIQKFININQRYNLGILVFLYALIICLEFFVILAKFLNNSNQSWDWTQTSKILIDALGLFLLIVLFRAFTKQSSRLKNYLLYLVLWIFLLNQMIFGYIEAATDDLTEIRSLGSMGILVSRVFVMHLMIMSLPIHKFLRVLPALFASLVSVGFIGLNFSETQLRFFLELFLCLLTSVFLGLLLSKKQDFLFEFASSAIQELTFCNNIIKGIPVGVLLTDLDYKILFKNNQMQNYFDTLPPNLQSPQDLFRQFKGAEIPEEGLVTFFKDAFHQRYEGGDTTNSNMEVCLEDVLDIMFRNYKVVENALRGSVPQEMYSVDSLPNSIKFRMKHLDTTIEVKVFPIQVASKDCALLLFLDHTERVVPLLGGQDSDLQYQFLASLSHELRTPLNSALALVQSSITEPAIPEELKDKLLYPAFHSMQILSYNIKDLIDFSKASCGSLGLKLETCNITYLLEKVVKLVEIQANKKSISIFSKIDPEIPHDWCTDPDRVCQAVLNLLSNAIKYTVKGFIVVSAKYLERKGMIKIKVSDTGVGMEKGDLSKLQKAFKDQELYFKKLNLHSTGIGLGLAVSNQICLGLGHTRQDYLKVKSTLNKGSEFKFYIDNKARINLTSFDQSPVNGTVETHDSLIADSSTMKLRQMRRGAHSTNNRYMTRKESVFSPHRSPKVLREFPSKDVDTMEDNKADDSLDASSDSSPSLYANTSLLNQRYLSFDSNMKRGSGVVAQFGSRHQSPLLKEVKLLNNEIDRPSKVEKVLIVDDDSFNILSLELMFKTFNVQHDHAYNGKEAIEKVKKNKYQMIMMDCNMPVMDGWEATKQIIGLINDGVIDNLVIVACTAFEDSENLMKCGEAGMKYIIQKPVSIDKLSDLLKKIAQ